MRAIVTWLGALGAVGAPHGEAAAGEAFPIPLTRSTFPLFVTADGLALVEFRSGGAPDDDFAQAAWLLRDVIPLGTVDVLREPQLALADVDHVLTFDPANAKALARRRVYLDQLAGM